MKVYTSYFYQIRNFNRNMVPVSTAIWDPRWFHTGNNVGEYRDKRGVWNGVRIPALSPATIDVSNCSRKGICDPSTCDFQKKYREYLNTLDFDKIYIELERLAIAVRHLENLDELPSIILIVHESPENPCSERQALQEYFKANGVECTELEYPIKKEKI